MTISLLDGTVVDTADISYNPSAFTFTWDSGAAGPVDITSTMPGSKMNLIPGWDGPSWNLNWYATHNPGAGTVGSTSTAANFFTDITTDPLTAPINALLGRPLDKPNALPDFNKELTTIALVALAIGAGAWLLGHSK